MQPHPEGVGAETVLLVGEPSEPVTALVRALRQVSIDVAQAPLTDEADWLPTPTLLSMVVGHGLTAEVRRVAWRLRAGRPGSPLVCWAPVPPAALGEVLAAGFDLWLPAEAPAAAVAAQLRVFSRLLRVAPEAAGSEIALPGLTIDLSRRVARTPDGPLPLTPTELRMLTYLARRPGRVVSAEELFDDSPGHVVGGDARDAVKVHIWRLRTKLAAAGVPPDLILNQRGFGYVLERRALVDQLDEAAGA